MTSCSRNFYAIAAFPAASGSMPGQVGADFVHDIDELVMVVEDDVEFEIGGEPRVWRDGPQPDARRRQRGGSEVIFTLSRRRGVGEDEFVADARAVKRDLEALKALLESRTPLRGGGGDSWCGARSS
jgi:hypothetical protein